MSSERTIVAAALSVLSTAKDVYPEGAPGGPMYLALSSKSDLTLDTFLIFMGSLVRLELLSRKGECYYITPKGRAYIEDIEAKLAAKTPA